MELALQKREKGVRWFSLPALNPCIRFPILSEIRTTGRSSHSQGRVRKVMKEAAAPLTAAPLPPWDSSEDLGPSFSFSLGPLPAFAPWFIPAESYQHQVAITFLYNPAHRIFIFSYGKVTSYAAAFGKCTERANTACLKTCVLPKPWFETITQVHILEDCRCNLWTSVE